VSDIDLGIVGEWIDDAVTADPDLMRRTMARGFTTGLYIGYDEDRNPCGCLVGAVALEAGFDVQSYILRGKRMTAPDAAAMAVRLDSDRTWAVGLTVTRLAESMGRIAVEAAIRERVSVALARREAVEDVIRATAEPSVPEMV
jgi:hypothetical protein